MCVFICFYAIHTQVNPDLKRHNFFTLSPPTSPRCSVALAVAIVRYLLFIYYFIFICVFPLICVSFMWRKHFAAIRHSYTHTLTPTLVTFLLYFFFLIYGNILFDFLFLGIEREILFIKHFKFLQFAFFFERFLSFKIYKISEVYSKSIKHQFSV